MKIVIVTPAAARVRNGNRNTAERWATFLRQLGHQVSIQVEWDGSSADLMLALHARRSHISIKQFSQRWPDRPLVVVLTGTDLYRDIQHDVNARESLQLATRLVVLQDMGPQELAPALREKTEVIYQSALPIAPATPTKRHFSVCVIGNLREEKDPLRCALAARLLPEDSRIRITHLGQALSPVLAQQAQELMSSTRRYRWLGGRPHWQVRRKLAHCRLVVVSSRMEGGANVISEALAADVPVIASRMPGNIGMLGADYAGYYPLEDEDALAKILYRAETSQEFYRLLQQQCRKRKELVQPERERAGLARLLAICVQDVPGLRLRAGKVS